VITQLDHRDVRKVQFTGRSTYVLSLPKKWIEEMHLKAGDQVTLVRELDNSLSVIPIFTAARESLNEVTTFISPRESGNTLRRKVVSIYLAGYNIIHLKIKSGRMNPELRDAVRELVRRNLVGTKYEFKNQIECPSCKRAVLYGVIHGARSSRLNLS
jgi:antitoxin component of MazEF toxin-antitoxin module